LFQKKDKTYSFDEYPTGVCVKTNKSYWFIQGKYKRKIPTLRILASWSFPFVIDVTDDDISSLVTAKSLGFRDGTIVRAMDGVVYLISNRERRRITNPDFLQATGKKHISQIRVASDAELSLHEIGKDLN
jgi:hypothetical protein